MKDDEMNNDPMLDSEGVGDAVSQYFTEHPELLEGIEPSHDLWTGIESRIQARVVPLAAHSTRSIAPSRMQRSVREHRGWMTMAAAAAVLVMTTASVTYVLTTRGGAAPANPGSVAVNSTASPLATQTVGTSPATNPAPINASSNAPADSTGVSRTSSATSLASAGLQNSAKGADDDRNDGGRHEGTRDVAQLASRPRLNARDEVRSTYDAEITTLRAALDSRRGQLDTATINTIEQNLQVIDHAIQQSKAALMKDPGSRFLNDQLDHSLAKKTDLLRAAALLPSA